MSVLKRQLKFDGLSQSGPEQSGPDRPKVWVGVKFTHHWRERRGTSMVEALKLMHLAKSYRWRAFSLSENLTIILLRN